jgi:galactokinase
MKVRAPGRVNLIGEHTDYTGGLVFPMAIDRWTTIEFEQSDNGIFLESANEEEAVSIDTAQPFDAAMSPHWGRYVGAVASLMESPRAISGRISTTIPVGAGLSSSAALEIAVALALGAELSATDLALLTQRAEHLATGVPTGIMDQLCIASARNGHGTMIDCRTLEVQHVPIPSDIKIVVRFIAHRTLVGSAYSDRVAECATAESLIGPLRDASLADVATIADSTIAARAKHVISENARVRAFADALTSGDYITAGKIMTDSHHSLAEDFAVSNDLMDAAVRDMNETPGVFGARMTGGGFGGCIVALCDPDAVIDGWHVQPVAAAAHLS